MSDELTTWRELLSEDYGAERFVAVAPDESVLDKKFDDDYGLAKGPRFLAWDDEWVYFPVVYDGAEWPGRVPRNPRPEPMGHVGGQ